MIHGPALQGNDHMKLADWIGLLRENQLDINFACVARVISHMLNVCLSSPFRVFEGVYFNGRVTKTPIKESPIFIIGHWRSGTTYLHYLMSRDKNLACVSTFQALAPEVFLASRRVFEPY